MTHTCSLWRGICLATVGWVCFCLPGAAAAQTVAETQTLSFGAIAIANNNAVRSLSVAINGDVSRDLEIILKTTAVPGQFQLLGFPASQGLSVVIDPILLSVAGDGLGKTFSVGFSYPPVITTDEDGDAVLNIGATLSTSGDGTPYDNVGYFGTATIELSW